MRYEIKGGTFPVVECRLSAGETMIAEGGAMVWMTNNLKMETSTGGGLLKGLTRTLSGQSMFLNYYTASSNEQFIAFGSRYAGRILAIDLSGGKTIIAQKTAFLAGESGVDIDVCFSKRLGAGFFGGEGFILQKLSGIGLAFLEIDGDLVEYDLKPGEELVIDQGYLAAMDESVTFDIQRVPGIKNILFGGEGLFLGHLTGPGKVWLQTMPFSGLVNQIIARLPSKSSN